jgi:hypothetical protein
MNNNLPSLAVIKITIFRLYCPKSPTTIPGGKISVKEGQRKTKKYFFKTLDKKLNYDNISNR